jgi:hypothetical protein
MQLLCEKCSRACINPILPLPDETLHAGEFFGSEVSPPPASQENTEANV